MNQESLTHYLSEHNILHDARIRLLGRGESNTSYLAEANEQKLVIRLLRDDVPVKLRFEVEHHYLRFIASLGIEFAPTSIYFDPQRHIHITSFVAGRDASIVDLDDTQIKLFVAQLKRLNAITYDEYLLWCKKEDMTAFKPQTVALRTKVNIDDRLSYIAQQKDDVFAQAVVIWAEPKVKVLLTSGKDAKLKTVFLHDDLRWNEGGGNLRVAGDKIIFIDWELTGFFEDAVPEIGDVLGSIPTLINTSTISKKLYEAYIDQEDNIPQLNKDIRYGILWGKLGNPLWAAERYLLLKNSNHPGVDRYRMLAEQGMKDAQMYFSEPLSNWFDTAAR